MSYQVLARKWRPKQFSELVGQEHVVRALSNALDAQRTHHAYLFAGTRGIGKTTIARIFAKSINCEQGASAEPCGSCEVCTAVDAGRFVDLLEIDAASNTGVDDVRELIENAQYAPSRGRYKVYLVDEVHMLSRSAFNALLKTLEEPPEHVKFLLATTDPEKLPMTVLSRCLKFNLKRLQPAQISGQLEHILQAEEIAFDAAAAEALALAANGSMRDGLSLLDQALAYGGGRLDAQETRAMLGTVGQADVVALVDALAQGDGTTLLAASHDIAEQAPDFAAIVDQLAAFLHRLQLRQLVGKAAGAQGQQEQAIARLAEQLSAEQVQLYYQFATRGRRELELAPDAQTGFEMLLLRMLAFAPAQVAAAGQGGAAGSGPAVRPAAPAPATPAAARPPQQAAPGADKPGGADAGARAAGGEVAEAAPPAPTHALFEDPARCAEDWHAWVGANAPPGPSGELARNAVLQSMDGTQWTLAVRRQLMIMAVAPMTDQLQDKLQASLGKPIRLHFVAAETLDDTPASRRQAQAQARLGEAEQAIRDDPVVGGLEAELGARVIPDSVRLLDN